MNMVELVEHAIFGSFARLMNKIQQIHQLDILVVESMVQKIVVVNMSRVATGKIFFNWASGLITRPLFNLSGTSWPIDRRRGASNLPIHTFAHRQTPIAFLESHSNTFLSNVNEPRKLSTSSNLHQKERYKTSDMNQKLDIQTCSKEKLGAIRRNCESCRSLDLLAERSTRSCEDRRRFHRDMALTSLPTHTYHPTRAHQFRFGTSSS
jgi:hypothetical protein